MREAAIRTVEIETILAEIRSAWSSNPELRLGQLLLNATSDYAGWPNIFYLPDSDLLAALERWKQPGAR